METCGVWEKAESAFPSQGRWEAVGRNTGLEGLVVCSVHGQSGGPPRGTQKDPEGPRRSFGKQPIPSLRDGGSGDQVGGGAGSDLLEVTEQVREGARVYVHWGCPGLGSDLAPSASLKPKRSHLNLQAA